MYKWVQEQLNTVLIFTIHNEQYIAGLASVVFLILLLYMYDCHVANKQRKRHRSFNQSIRGEAWMTTPEQENIERVLISDAVCDGIEELIAIGKLSADRGRIWYRRFGNLLNLPDLLEKHEVMLKDRIRRDLKGISNVEVLQFPEPKTNGNGASGILTRLRAQATAK